MTYKVIKRDKKFWIIELATDKVIEKLDDYVEAKARCKFFKRGGGWAGWTPDFVIRETIT